LIVFFKYVKDSWKEKTKLLSSPLEMKQFVGLNCSKHASSKLSQLLRATGALE